MKELMAKKENELVKMLQEKREALRVFNFALSGGKVKNMKEGANLKKEIARVMTAINAK